MSENFFTELYAVSYNNEAKQKMGLSYLPWPKAYAAIMKKDPFFEWGVYQYTPKVCGSDGITVIELNEPRDYWIQNGTCMVKTWIAIHKSALVDGYDGDDVVKKDCFLPIMNQRNAPIKAEEVTTTDVNKAIWRCFVKNVSMFGPGLHLYNGEEFSEEDSAVLKLQEECFDLITKKCSKSETAKKKVGDICKERLGDDPDPRHCDNKETLLELKHALLAVR